MRKIIKLFLPILILFLLAGCSKLISTEYKDVEVKIVDCCHRNSYTTWIFHSKGHMTPIRHSEVNTITVSYNDNQYVIGGKEVYYKYKDKIGETATGVLEIKNYEDGTKRFDIISLS